MSNVSKDPAGAAACSGSWPRLDRQDRHTSCFGAAKPSRLHERRPAISLSLHASRRARIGPDWLRPGARTSLATHLSLDQVPRRVASRNPLPKENRMAIGDTNRGFQNIKFDKNTHQISFGDTSTRVPVRDFLEYLREQGVEERDVLPVWQSGASKNRSNESTGRSG